jgi:hypothetical protein
MSIETPQFKFYPVMDCRATTGIQSTCLIFYVYIRSAFSVHVSSFIQTRL